MSKRTRVTHIQIIEEVEEFDADQTEPCVDECRENVIPMSCRRGAPCDYREPEPQDASPNVQVRQLDGDEALQLLTLLGLRR